MLKCIIMRSNIQKIIFRTFPGFYKKTSEIVCKPTINNSQLLWLLFTMVITIFSTQT